MSFIPNMSNAFCHNVYTLRCRIRTEKDRSIWCLPASFEMERNTYHNYLNEIVSDRYALINGLQLLRDELQLAAASKTDMHICGADLSLPGIVTTLAYTNCGDR